MIPANHQDLRFRDRVLEALVRAPFRMIDLAFFVGTILAVTDSWQKYHSATYSLLCGFASWTYVWFPAIYDGVWMK